MRQPPRQPPKSPLGALILATRRTHRLSQRALAAKAGLHYVTVCRLERGGKATLDTLRALAKALALETDILVRLAA